MSSRKNLKDAFEEGEDKTAFEHELINSIEPLRFVWDTKDPEYKNRGKRQAAISKVASSLGKPAEVCLAVWESLRSQYLACKRKLPTGSGADAVPSFRHYESMLFLSAGQTPSKTICSMGKGEDSERTSDSIVIELVDEPSEGSEVIATLVIDDKQTKSATSSTSHEKFKGKRKSDPVEQEMLKCLKTINVPRTEDEFDSFGKAMACKLRRISSVDQKAAAECEMEIHKVIFEAELKFL